MTYGLVLTALADPTRRSILESLQEAPLSVGEVASRQPVSRPAVSQHLKVLQEAGLVRASPKGTRRVYSIERHGLEELRRYLDGFWTDVLSGYAAEVDRRLSDNR